MASWSFGSKEKAFCLGSLLLLLCLQNWNNFHQIPELPATAGKERVLCRQVTLNPLSCPYICLQEKCSGDEVMAFYASMKKWSSSWRCCRELLWWGSWASPGVQCFPKVSELWTGAVALNSRDDWFNLEISTWWNWETVRNRPFFLIPTFISYK